MGANCMGKAIVCFTGLDGSGKTSHALALMAELRKRGIPSKYVWCRWFPGLADPFHFVIRKTLGYTAEKYKFCKPLQITYQCLIFLDYSISIIFKIRIPAMLSNCVLLIDRYIYDTLADLDFIQFNVSIFFKKSLIMMNPKPNITFLIDVPPQVATSRKNELQLIQAKRYRKIYHNLAKIYDFHTIVNIDFNEAHNKILREVLKLIT